MCLVLNIKTQEWRHWLCFVFLLSIDLAHSAGVSVGGLEQENDGSVDEL